jgi:hypothetical protein
MTRNELNLSEEFKYTRILWKRKLMRKKISILFLLFSFVFANYNVGDFISESDQNLTKSTCYAGNGYEVDDNWKLADWNGALNGGNYNVIFIEMSATW